MTDTQDLHARVERLKSWASGGLHDGLYVTALIDVSKVADALTAALDRAETAEAQRDHNAEVIDLLNVMLTQTKAQIAEARNAGGGRSGIR